MQDEKKLQLERISMVRFPEVWYWVVVAGVIILAAGVTTLCGETNDVPVLEETSSPDNTDESDLVPEVELQPEDPTSRDTADSVDSDIKVELQQLFNDLRREYLDTRSKSIDWWLEFIGIILTFFAVLIAIAGYIGFREFRRLRDEARQHVSEIRKDKAKSDELMQNMRQKGNAEVFDVLSGSEEFEKGLRDLLQNSELSVIDKAIADASALQQDGAIKDAIEKWRSIANIVGEADSDLAARSWFSVGYLHSQEEEPEKAIPAYDKAIYLKPDYAEAYNNRGASNGELGQYDAAITDLDEAIVLDPNDAEAHYNRGIVHFSRNNYDDAFTDFNTAILLKPNHTSAHANRGLSRARLGQYDAAITDLDQAIRLNPDDAQTYYNRGCINLLLGAHRDASVNFDESIHFENAKSDFQTALDLAIQQGQTELKTDIEERLHELNNVE